MPNITEELLQQAAQQASLPQQSPLSQIKGYGSDIADSSIGRLVQQLGGFALDTTASMISPAYKENLIGQNQAIRDQELQRRNQQYVGKAFGQRQQQQHFDPITQEMLQEDGVQQMPMNTVQATGYQQHQNPSRLASQLMSAPNKITRAAGGSILNDLMTQTAQGSKLHYMKMGTDKENQMTNAVYDPQTGEYKAIGDPYQRSSGVTVNTGRERPPAGYRWKDSNHNLGVEAIPGGPVDPQGTENVLKETKSYNKQNLPFKNLNAQLKSHYKLLDSTGTFAILPTAKRARLRTSYYSIMMALKEQLNLGVITGPDMEIVNSIINDPTDYKHVLLDKEDMLANISAVEKIVAKQQANLGESFPNRDKTNEPKTYNYSSEQVREQRKQQLLKKSGRI